jgi:ATP-binding cassette subfamily F protein uup
MSYLISINSGSLTFGNRIIFKDINLNVFKGDKICIVGRNGSGKSSLMKVMMNALDLDSGTISKKKNLTVGYLSQELINNNAKNVFEYVFAALTTSNLNNLEAENLKYKADEVIYNLGLNKDASLDSLSGGQLRRANLAKILLEEPELLLLDEPTNHMDIYTVNWLENYISNFKGAMLFVSHDRAFLNKLSNKTIYLDRHNLYINNKGFSEFEEFQNRIWEIEQIELGKLAKKLQSEELWLQQGVTARRKRNQNRLHKLFELREQFSKDTSRNSNQNKDVGFLNGASNTKQSKIVINASNIDYEYKQNENITPIFKDLSLTFYKGEKVGIVGRNGVGKSTLLKLLSGDYTPLSGVINIPRDLKIGYFDQNRSLLDENKNLLETLETEFIFSSNGSEHVSSFLKKFLFTSDQLNAKVKLLSGGEQNKLMLAKILAKHTDLLILDEPTNDLDINSLEFLQELISEYEGTVIISSHDRDFLEKVVTRTITIKPEVVLDNFGWFFEKEEEKAKLQKLSKKIISPEKEAPIAKIKMSYKETLELSELPSKIENCNLKIAELERNLADNNNLNHTTLYNELAVNIKLLHEYEERWLILEEKNDSLKK